MRLNATPPAGAGRVQHVTLTDKLLKVIDGLGQDKYGNPVGIRSPELAAASGVPIKSITALLGTAVAKGRVVVCKVTSASGQEQNEYRQGGGLPPPEFTPLNTRRAGIARSTRAARRAPIGDGATGTLPQRDAEPETPVFLSSTTPQPAVGNTGSTRSDSSTIPTEARAVTADEATPKPEVHAALNEEPAVRKASAGDAFNITIDDTGALIIGTDEGVIELQPTHAKRLGHFMVGSQGIWNPF